jgi:hypothetical protein
MELRAEIVVEVRVVFWPRSHEPVGAVRVAPSFIGAPRRVQILREPRLELRRAEERPQPVGAESAALEELPGHVVVVAERVEHDALVASFEGRPGAREERRELLEMHGDERDVSHGPLDPRARLAGIN